MDIASVILAFLKAEEGDHPGLYIKISHISQILCQPAIVPVLFSD